MKKLFYIVMIVLLGGVNNTVSAGVDGEVENSPLRDVKIKFATRSSFINGDCEDDRGICLRIEITIDSHTGSKVSGYNGTGIITLVENTKLLLNILTDTAEPAKNNDIFFVNGDISLNKEICEMLGVESCVIKKGKYQINSSDSEFGSVMLNVVTD